MSACVNRWRTRLLSKYYCVHCMLMPRVVQSTFVCEFPSAIQHRFGSRLYDFIAWTFAWSLAWRTSTKTPCKQSRISHRRKMFGNHSTEINLRWVACIASSVWHASSVSGVYGRFPHCLLLPSSDFDFRTNELDLKLFLFRWCPFQTI